MVVSLDEEVELSSGMPSVSLDSEENLRDAGGKRMGDLEKFGSRLVARLGDSA